MMIKRFLGGLCGVAVALSFFGATAGTKAPFINENSDDTSVISTEFMKAGPAPHIPNKGIEVKFNGTKEIHPSEFRASYTEVNYKSLRGETSSVSVDKGTIVLKADEGVNLELSVVEYYSGSVVFREEAEHVISYECGSLMKPNVPYYVEANIHFVANDFFDDALVLSVDETGNLYFVESPVYKYNVEQFSNLKDTDSYLKGCLIPERDMECDNEDIIRISNEICDGARTDYEKVDKIYSYIVDNMYYDYDQAYDYRAPYEDDALSLLRRNIAVCEGFSNVFVALCRVQGIPACETFGSGYGYDELWSLNMANVNSSNHAWVAVFVGGEWLIMDPTWDNMNEYYMGKSTLNESTRNFVFIPMESFSFTHIYFNADTSHAMKRSGECGPDSTFEIDKYGVCTIYGSGSVCLPDEVDDFFMLVFDEDSDITEIADEAFVNCDLLNYVILPDGVEKIGEYAFYHCENLEYVYIPDTVYSIGKDAFWVCDKLAYIEIPDGADVGKDAFNMCPRLVLSVQEEDQVDMSTYNIDIAQLIVRE